VATLAGDALVDDVSLVREAHVRTRDLHDLDAPGSRRIPADVAEVAPRRRVGDLLGLDEPRLDAFMRDLWTEYLGTLNVELADYCRGLRPRYRTAIISNSFVGARSREQERYHFDQITDLIVYSHEVGMSKPDPRIYRLACARLGVRPAETVFVDDNELMVDGARAVGIQAVLFEDNAQAIAAIEDRLRAAP